MTNNILCPHCGREVEVTEVLRHQIESQVSESLSKKHKEELERELKKTADEIQKQAEEKSLTEIRDLKKQISEKDQKVNELREQELKLRERERKMEEEKKEFELKVKRQLDEERKTLEENILKKAAEEHYLKDKEKDKMIDGLKNSLAEAQRKATVGSQQLQGEVLELDFETALKNLFPNDDIAPVEKGVKGADIRQTVRSPKGFVCGVILWETKSRKAWSDKWIDKLKQDLRAEKANIPAIISTDMPKDVTDGMGLKDGVWVTNYALALPLATLLRKNLLDIGFEKAKSIHRGEKADHLYEYVTSHEFIQQIENIIEVYRDMTEQISKERAAYERSWRAREGQAKRLIDTAANVVGSIQGKVGQNILQVKSLDHFELESGDEEKEQTKIKQDELI